MTGEALLHEQFIAYLQKLGLPWSRSRMDKATTSEKGHPDFTVYGPGNRACFVEFKVRPNRLSDAQTCRVRELERAGCFVCVAYDLETAVHHLASIFTGGVHQHDDQSVTPAPSEPKFYLVRWRAGVRVIRQDVDKTVTDVRAATTEDLELIPYRTPAVE